MEKKLNKMYSDHPDGGAAGEIPYVIFGHRDDKNANPDEIFMSWPTGVNSNGTTPKLSMYGDAFKSLGCCHELFEKLSMLENPDGMTIDDFTTILDSCGFQRINYDL